MCFETTTTEAGSYVFPVVTPGQFELTVESRRLAKFQADFTEMQFTLRGSC